MTGLSDLLARGIKAARELGPATDNLTEELALIERELSELNLGVSASVSMGQGERLEFCKEGAIWRLVVEHKGSRNLLINSSRQHRIDAVPLLPALIGALVVETEKKLGEISTPLRKVASLRAFLSQVNGGQDPGPVNEQKPGP